jgi:hypothetical protein
MLKGKSTCHTCGPVDPVLNIQVRAWQCATGEWDGRVFTATDHTTYYDSEETLLLEVACPFCKYKFMTAKGDDDNSQIEVVWN